MVSPITGAVIMKDKQPRFFKRLRNKTSKVTSNIKSGKKWFNKYLPGYVSGMTLVVTGLVGSITGSTVTQIKQVIYPEDDLETLIQKVAESGDYLKFISEESKSNPDIGSFIVRGSGYVALFGAGLVMISILPLLTPAGWERFEQEEE